MQVKGKKQAGFFKKLIRFMSKGLWESTYRRKKERALYRYHAFGPSPEKEERIYYPRYRWIRKETEESSGKH
jgi:hypothetical protein